MLDVSGPRAVDPLGEGIAKSLGFTASEGESKATPPRGTVVARLPFVTDDRGNAVVGTSGAGLDQAGPVRWVAEVTHASGVGAAELDFVPYACP